MLVYLLLENVFTFILILFEGTWQCVGLGNPQGVPRVFGETFLEM